MLRAQWNCAHVLRACEDGGNADRSRHVGQVDVDAVNCGVHGGAERLSVATRSAATLNELRNLTLESDRVDATDAHPELHFFH